MNYRPSAMLITYLTTLHNRRYRLGYAIHRRAKDTRYPTWRLIAMRNRRDALALQIALIEDHMWTNERFARAQQCR